MDPFKGKSLKPNKISDEQIKASKTHAARFMTFESAIRMFIERYNLSSSEVDELIGYQVTEDGITMIFD